MSAIELVEIVVRIRGERVCLTPNEARVLRDELNKVINDPPASPYPIYIPAYRYWWPEYPPATSWRITTGTTTGDTNA